MIFNDRSKSVADICWNSGHKIGMIYPVEDGSLVCLLPQASLLKAADLEEIAAKMREMEAAR